MRTNSESFKVSRRAFLGASACAFCLPRSLFAAFEADADAASNDVVLRFAAMSDVHFNGEPDAPEVGRFRRALEFMYKYSRTQKYATFDALVVAGDISNHGVEKEIALFKKTMDAGIDEKETQTILCMGNHEFYGGNKPLWKKTFGVDPNRRYEVAGFRFIALSPEKGSMSDGDYLYALDWFDSELAAATAADPKKPIFVLQHYHVTPTVYGSRGADNWGAKDLFETLQKYPRVVDFSGHSHYPIADPRSAWQGRFSAFGTGTLSYFEMGGEGGKYEKFPNGYRNAAEFYVVEVRRDNSVVLKPYDLITDSFFDVVYYIAEPGAVEKYAYTDERYKTSQKPIWSDDAAVVCSETFPNGATLTFPQATCSDVVHSYRVDVEKRSEKDVWEAFGSSYFWSEYYFQKRPSEMRVELVDLEEDASYRAQVVALNPFFKESERSLAVEFATPSDPTETVDKKAAAPDANVLDVVFDGGKAANAPTNGLETQKTIEMFGEPKIVRDAAIGGAFVAAFDGIDDYYKIQFGERDYGKLRRATLAVRFKIDAFSDANVDLFANTETRGICFEINAKDRCLEFWASVDGQYRIISAPFEAGRYVDAFATFDGKAIILYLDGKEAARQDVSGKLTHPSGADVRAFCVGSDIAPGGKGGSFFRGKIARARLFNWALTSEQVANLSKDASK